MVSNSIIKKQQQYMLSNWWYVGAAIVAVLSLAVTSYVGWQGLVLLVYSVLILAVGRGKKIEKETGVNFRQ